MLIIVDKRLPGEAKQALLKYGELIEFASPGITYKAISGHPDIFFCQAPSGLVVAPNTPVKYLSFLAEKNVIFTAGNLPVGNSYPETAHYNALATRKYLIHNPAITDQVVKDLATPRSPLSSRLSPLSLNQGYTRCNLINLNEDRFITSDKGIEKALLTHGLDVQYVSPAGILLPGFDHGFFGGCCGVLGDKLFVTGKLESFPEGDIVQKVAIDSGFEVVELYDGPLFDAGGICFIPI